MESNGIYPLVISNIAIEHGHRNSGFTHQKWWIFPFFGKRLPEGTSCRQGDELLKGWTQMETTIPFTKTWGSLFIIASISIVYQWYIHAIYQLIYYIHGISNHQLLLKGIVFLDGVWGESRHTRPARPRTNWHL